MSKIPAVVIRASDNCFLDVLRALALENIPVVPVVFTWRGAGPWLSEKSCFYQNPVVIENPAENEYKAALQMEELGKQLYAKFEQKLLLISTSDTALVFVNRYFEKLQPYFLQMGGPTFSQPCWNELYKDRFAKTMEEHGVPIPQTIAVAQEEDIAYAVNHSCYPCIYKPAIKDPGNSFQRTHAGRKAVECADAQALEYGLRQEIQAGHTLVVQEKIEFDSLEDEASCYLYADAEGCIRMVSAQHKLYEYPAPYGTGVVSKLYFSDVLAEIATKTIQALHWHGFVGVELMRNRKTGQWLVIEANLRPWLSNYFQAAAGFNYLSMLYRDAMGQLEPYTVTRIPGKENEIYRVNLSEFIRKCVAECGNVPLALQQVWKFVSQHVGKIVFSYAVSQDTAPGECEIFSLRKTYPGQDAWFDKLAEQIRKNG